jgi:phage N-6-adenine-methyltransferase
VAVNPALFSSATDLHTTPQDLFDQLDAEFHFTLDAAALKANAKCEAYYGPDHVVPEFRDGLEAKWMGTVWCNPPYGREIGKWCQKAARAAYVYNTTSVLLVPARTETQWWKLWVAGSASEVRFLEGRLKFGNAKNSAPFPSAIVVYRGWRGPYRWWVA